MIETRNAKVDSRLRGNDMENGGPNPGAALALLFALLTALFALAGICRGQTAPKALPDEEGTLLLVREWDAKTGELVGWMPIHRTAIRLRQLSGPPFNPDLNDAVFMQFLNHRGIEVDEEGTVDVAPQPKRFAGEDWLPVMRDINPVRIQKRMFFVRAILFGESKWRRASEDSKLETRNAKPKEQK